MHTEKQSATTGLEPTTLSTSRYPRHQNALYICLRHQSRYTRSINDKLALQKYAYHCGYQCIYQLLSLFTNLSFIRIYNLYQVRGCVKNRPVFSRMTNGFQPGAGNGRIRSQWIISTYQPFLIGYQPPPIAYLLQVYIQCRQTLHIEKISHLVILIPTATVPTFNNI